MQGYSHVKPTVKSEIDNVARVQYNVCKSTEPPKWKDFNMQNTIHYYNQKAKQFSEETVHVDFTQIQNTVRNRLPSNAFILDFGCGSGRDTKYFLEHGYIVDAIDGSPELCKLASQFTGIQVREMLFHQLDEVEKYDAIWACASILHLKKQELPDVLKKMCRALKNDGIMYISFKYGDFEGERNGRYFTDLTEDTAGELIGMVTALHIEKQWVSGDVRAGRGEERWLNMILRKQKRGIL